MQSKAERMMDVALMKVQLIKNYKILAECFPHDGQMGKIGLLGCKTGTEVSTSKSYLSLKNNKPRPENSIYCFNVPDLIICIAKWRVQICDMYSWNQNNYCISLNQAGGYCQHSTRHNHNKCVTIINILYFWEIFSKIFFV